MLGIGEVPGFIRRVDLSEIARNNGPIVLVSARWSMQKYCMDEFLEGSAFRQAMKSKKKK